MKKIIITLVLILIFLISCKNKEKKIEEIRTEVLNGVTHVYNPAVPQKGVLELDVEKTFQIESQEGDTPFFFHAIDYDKDGNIYFADGRTVRINKYNREGKYLTGFLRKGRGPGEFPFINHFQIVENHIWVLGSRPSKIAEFNTDGKLIMEKQMKKRYRRVEIIDKSRFIGNFDERYLKEFRTEDDLMKKIPFSRFSALLNYEEKVLTPFFKSDKTGGWQNFYIYFYDPRITPFFLYKYNREKGNVYFALSSEYKIILKDLEGRTDKIINREYQNKIIKEKDIKEFLELRRCKRLAKAVEADSEGTFDLKKMIKKQFPESFCIIAGIFLLPNEFIAVSRFTGIETPFEIDIFDSEGRYLYLVKMPGEISDLEGLKFLKNGVAGLKHLEEKDIYMEYRVKNLPEIFGS